MSGRRRSIALGAAVRALLPGQRSIVALQADEDDAAIRFAAVVAVPTAELLQEVERRAELFAGLRVRSPRSFSHETPRAAALRSVTNDLEWGRL